MNYIVRISLVLLFTFFAFPALANNDMECNLIGTWVGYDAGGWATQLQVNVQNASAGTNTLQLLRFDPTLDGFFTDAVGVAALGHGVWKRTGGKTYDQTGVFFVGDSNHNTLYVMQVSVQYTLEGCNTAFVENTVLQFFWPYQDFFNEVPWLVLTLDDHYAHRLMIDVELP